MSSISIALFFAMTCSLVMCVWTGFSSHQNTKAKSFFVMMMLGFAAVLGEMAVYHFKQHGAMLEARSINGYVVIFSVPLSAAIPVFFYLYVKSALRLDSSFNRRDAFHLLIPFIYLLLMLPFSMLDMADKSAFYGKLYHGEDIPWPLSMTPTRFTRLASAAVLGIFYLQLCWQELHSQINLKKQDILKTVKHLKRNYLVMSAGIGIIFLFLMTRLPREFTWLLSVLLMGMAFASSWLFIKLPEMGHRRSTAATDKQNTPGAIEQPKQDVIATRKHEQAPLQKAVEEPEKNYRSSVTEQMANQFMQALTHLLDEGIYKDSTLSLGKLANEMKVSNHHLSQIINQQYQGSYYDLIHSYRINEAKRLLTDTALSIADITYEVGYNSKSVFYTEFKRQTQLTPSQYKKSTTLAMQ